MGPTRNSATTPRCIRSTSETVAELLLATTARCESGVMTSVRGSSPTGISASTSNVSVSTTVTELLSGLTAATSLPSSETATAEALTRLSRGWVSVGTDSTSIEVVPIGVGSSVGAAVVVTAAASGGVTDPSSEGVSCTAWASRITVVVK